MKNLKYSDRAILEEMGETYGKDALVSAIAAIAAKCGKGNEIKRVKCECGDEYEHECDCECDIKPIGQDEAVLEFIKMLEGARIRLREIHWSATHNSTHKLTDDMISKIESYEDSIAEDFMGVVGVRITVGQILPSLPQSTELLKLIDEILCSTYTLKASIEKVRQYNGLDKILDDFIDDLFKYKYLATMQ